MKVALFTGNYNHVRDGVSLTLNRLVKFLLEQDVEVLVFGPTIKKPQVNHYGTLISVPSLKMPGRPEYRFTTGFPEKSRRELEKFQPDIVHIATPDILGYKALNWALEHNKQVVSSFHTHFSSYLKYYNLGILEPVLWKYMIWFYNHCRHIYVPTPSMAEELKAKGIKGELKIWARGVNTEQFNPDKRDRQWRKDQGFNENDIVITFISRLVWEKNLALFANVIKQLQEKYPLVKALVVGDGPAGPELKELLPGAVYKGFLRGEELATSYASSDIFFFPSDTETFGNVTLEAMASGLPCVVANAVGSKSLVSHNENGFLAPVSKEKLFYDYLARLVEDRELREKMARDSLNKAKNYSWSHINGKLLDYYYELLEVKDL